MSAHEAAYELIRNKNSGSYFIYDLDGLKSHAEMLASGNAIVHCAVKSNPLSHIMRTFSGCGMRFDVASIGELKHLISLGVPGSSIIMTGPAKSQALIKTALDHGLHCFVVESLNQLHDVQELARNYNYKPSVLLRIQLQWPDESAANSIGGSSLTAFGMDIDTAKEAMKRITLPFLGFHVFQWGNILDLERIEWIWQRTFDAVRTISPSFEVLDVGGGLGIPYRSVQTRLAWIDVNALIGRFKARNALKQFWLELGRYLVGPYGRYVTRVIDVKTTYGRKLVVLEGGINHTARSVLVKDYFEARLIRQSSRPKVPTRMHGPLCIASDFLGEQSLPDDVAVGDLIELSNTGAYGFTESLPFFLCHDSAGEIVVSNGRAEIVREMQGANWWLK